MAHEREKLGSRLGFLLLSAGCAIGLGNVWRFPYITGKYGGAAFVLIYLLFLVIFGLPVMVMEFAIGRASKQNIGLAMKTLEKPGTYWHLYGPVAVAGNYLLMMYYTTITGWLIAYFFHYLDGSLAGLTGDAVGAYFGAMLSDAGPMIAWMALTVVIGFATVSAGLQKGVEKITKWMVTCLLFLLVVLAIHSCLLPGGGAGLSFYLKPSAEHIREAGLGTVIFAAMSQAFFTLSLGIGALTIFGSYIGKEKSLTGESVRVIGLDTFVAFMAGLVIFPACSAFGIESNAGPSLIFITLPNIFGKMAGGRFWGAMFFLFMSFAALSTVNTVFENIVSYWIDAHGWSRGKACIVNCVAVFLLSLPCTLGFNLWSSFQPLGEGTGVLDLEDLLVSNIILPLGSLLFCLFCTNRHGWGWKNFIAEADTGEGMKLPRWMHAWATWGMPILFVIVFVRGLWDIFA